MSIQSGRGQTEKDCHDCEEDQENDTQKSINKERVKLCDTLYESFGSLLQQETKVTGEENLYNNKICLFNSTEENYQYFRNLDIVTGTEILQTNELTKVNVDNLKKWNTDLNSNLKKLVTLIKDTKSKFTVVSDAACTLSREINSNGCNSAQWRAITGKIKDSKNENCKDDEPPKPPCGETAETNFEWLTCMPKGLIKDIDYIFQSSADVVGIQIFSNINTLEPLQKELTEQSKSFEKSVNEIMKLREDDLKKLQEDLIKSVKSVTQSVLERNNMGSKFYGYYKAVKFLCCPVCGCVKNVPVPESGNNNSSQGRNKDCPKVCPPRLEGCKDCICKICGDVKKSFCCHPEEADDGGCKD